MRLFKRSTLPENYEEHTLSSMLPGERAYTLPWGMWVDLDRQCWLHPNYPARAEAGGTAEMPVRKFQDGTFEVNIMGLDHRWTPTTEPAFAGDHGLWLPVSNLIS